MTPVRQIKLLFILAVFSVTVAACSSKNGNDPLLAEVEGEKLYLSDIYFPDDLTPDDSVRFLKLMIDKWVVQQLMYLDAESKLDDAEKEAIEKQVEKTRKGMIVSAMEGKILTDSIKVSVSYDEVMDYYRTHPNEFLLKENIVKIQYIKVKKSNRDNALFKTLLQSDKVSDKTLLKTKAGSEALNYFLEDNVWLYFNDILKEIPIRAENQEEFLQSTTFHEITTDSVVYFVRINGYMLTDSPAPLILVKDRIESVLLAKKKNQLLDAYRNKIYENALKEKKVTLYLD